MPVLAVRGLRVESSLGHDIVDDVSFDLEEAELLGIVGESGCGKTTTALALLGHAREGNRITAGSIEIGGTDILALRGAARRSMRGTRISYVAQDPTSSLSPRMRVGAQIAEVARRDDESIDADARVRELFERVELPSDNEFVHRYPFELSGGQQQRVGIAMALAGRPTVVVLDEPTTGLDVTTQARILDLIRELRHETRVAFVYVTHDLAVVDSLADRSLVMYAGRIVEQARQEDLFRRPAHPYTSMLLGSVPRIATRYHLVGIAGTAPSPGRRPEGCFYAPRCPLADDRCRAEFPAASDVEAAHTVRCWHASELWPKMILTERPQGEAVVEQATGLLGVSNVVASYKSSGQTVLHDVSFQLDPGECLALVGQSGSGKTTLGRCIAGLHRPDSGVIALDGKQLGGLAADRDRSERQAIQLVFQNPERSLNPSRTIESIIMRPLQLFGTARGDRQAKIAAVLDQVRLPARLLTRYPRELSGGEKQRVAIARALITEPTVLVSDEITSALDVSTQAAIVSLLEELRENGLAILFITHNLALVNSIADRVLVLQAGEVRELGTTAEVIGAPSHSYTRELIASAPDLKVGAAEASNAQ
ncbi:MAG TPA: ABC transporter ATP-binding protein [Gaiellaceae bacterium]|jgi:peptide/nickel transport system ATP-binding protein|nr:ABC transporter ATP-binding protein [Gaiellaceae bacterium]